MKSKAVTVYTCEYCHWSSENKKEVVACEKQCQFLVENLREKLPEGSFVQKDRDGDLYYVTGDPRPLRQGIFNVPMIHIEMNTKYDYTYTAHEKKADILHRLKNVVQITDGKVVDLIRKA